MTAPAYSHVHSALASAHFDLAGAVHVLPQRDDEDSAWAVFLDDSLARWEVFVDAAKRRVFVSQPTWASLDGTAQIAFEDDFMRAYRGSDRRELRALTAEVYQAGARRRARVEGTDVVRPTDRIADLQRRATEAVVAAAGVSEAPGAGQLQVLAVRHAQLVEDLAVLEADMARLRSAVELSGSALRRAFG